MNRALFASLVPLLLLAGCSSCRKTDAARSDTKEGAKDPASAEAPRAPEHIAFAHEGWSGARGPCTESLTAQGCDSEWRHVATHQLVRVFFVALPDERGLNGFMAKLESDVTSRGGIVERIDQGGNQLIRYLERARVDGDAGSIEVASLSYVLVGRDAKAVHLITSVVPVDDQQPSDERLRALLGTASWSP